MQFQDLAKGIFERILLYWKAALIAVCALVIVGSFLFIRGCKYGEDRMDAKWRSQIATSKPVEIRRDTVIKYIPQPQSRGTASGIPIQVTKQYQNTIDSLKAIVEVNDAVLQDLLQPYSSTIETPEIGKLEVTVWPGWKNIDWKHTPPPMKIETVTIEKERMVLVPRSTWETIRDYGIGALAGGAIVYAATRLVK